MTPQTPDDVRKELDKVIKYSRDEAQQAIAAGILVLMADMRSLWSHIREIKAQLGIK